MSWQLVLSFVLIGSYLLALIALLHALLKARHPQSALGWVVVIITLPLIGSFIYFVFGINRVDSRAAKLMSDGVTRRSMFLLKTAGEYTDLEPNYRFNILEHPIIRVGEEKRGSLFRLSGNHIEPLFNGDEAYPKMLEAINRAEREIFLCTYIFKGEIYGQAFVDALIAAHERGVDVRVIVDWLGTCLYRSRPWKRLRKAGITVYRFTPPKLFPPMLSINLRMHRKVLVCDYTAFTGGMNISDGHVMDCPCKDHIQDLHFLCKGPIVTELREAFLMDWTFVTNKDDGCPLVIPPVEGDMDCRVVLDGPGTPIDPLQDLLCGVFSCAQKRITVMTPYFLPPREMISAFVSATARGVDVRIILPQALDHPTVQWASNHMLPVLLDSGVKIYRQPPPFAHTKVILIDDMYVCLGSTNLDPRSLSLNFEMNMEVFSPELNARLQKYADSILARSPEVELEKLMARPVLAHLRDSAMWIFSPYM